MEERSVCLTLVLGLSTRSVTLSPIFDAASTRRQSDQLAAGNCCPPSAFPKRLCRNLISLLSDTRHYYVNSTVVNLASTNYCALFLTPTQFSLLTHSLFMTILCSSCLFCNYSTCFCRRRQSQARSFSRSFSRTCACLRNTYREKSYRSHASH